MSLRYSTDFKRSRLVCYSYEAFKLNAQCMRGTIFHTQLINAPELFVYEESWNPAEFPKYPYSIKHDLINGTSPGVFAELVSFSSSNQYICFKLGHFLDTCKSGLSSISNESSIDDSSNFIANSFKLQLSPEFENDDQIIDVQVILALSPENLSNWELQSVDYNYNQITSKFPTFNQPIKPNFDNFYQTVELVLGSQTWDALKISQTGKEMKGYTEMVSKLMEPASMSPSVENIDTAMLIVNDFLKIPQMTGVFTKRTMFTANSKFLASVTTLLNSQVPAHMDLNKRSSLEHEICERTENNSDYVIYSNLGKAGPFAPRECIDEIKVDENEVIVLTPIYFNISSNSIDNVTGKTTSCHRRDQYVLISEFWYGNLMRLTAFCDIMPMYLSLTNHIKISYVKKSSPQFDGTLGYIYALDVFPSSIDKKDVELITKDGEKDDQFPRNFWREHPKISLKNIKDYPGQVGVELSNTYIYNLKMEQSNTSGNFFFNFVQHLISEAILVEVTSPLEKQDSHYHFGILHFPAGNMDPNTLTRKAENYRKITDSKLSLSSEIVSQESESTEASVYFSDFDECSSDQPFCDEATEHCVNQIGSFFCQTIVPDKRADINETSKQGENDKNKTLDVSKDDANSLQNLGGAVELGSTESPTLEQAKKPDLSLVIMALCIVMGILILTGIYCVYKKKFSTTHVYRVRHGRSRARP